MRTNRSHLTKILGTLAMLALAGCAGVPPSNVATSRMDYGQAIAESWKQQTLTNVVRLRYADAPVRPLKNVDANGCSVQATRLGLENRFE